MVKDINRGLCYLLFFNAISFYIVQKLPWKSTLITEHGTVTISFSIILLVYWTFLDFCERFLGLPSIVNMYALPLLLCFHLFLEIILHKKIIFLAANCEKYYGKMAYPTAAILSIISLMYVFLQ
ncbi:hypothetical protein CKK33_06435 [Mucilaginibacter sp. MD40]|nr:hypothetical protein CKK33_06435 [Mucilaginibacter sp. MD40]